MTPTLIFCESCGTRHWLCPACNLAVCAHVIEALLAMKE